MTIFGVEKMEDGMFQNNIERNVLSWFNDVFTTSTVFLCVDDINRWLEKDTRPLGLY